ncbi:DNA alkylation repair protein [Eubacteriales bacterium OttesenSCG-928-A19]|nr:DNA alkylation repair protein [Eubacteriales bacterium OttesenSCG-928-A19]
MTKQALHARLLEMADEPYRRFNSGLLPGVSDVLGVRMPALRKLARQLAQEDWQPLLAEEDPGSHEGVVLQGLILGYAQWDFASLRPHIELYVERLSNWAQVDTFCASLKLAAAEPEPLWAFIRPYFDRQETYPLRFAIVMALFYFLDEAHIDEVLRRLDGVRHEDYYVRMAVAWAVSMAYVARPDITGRLLAEATMDDWTYNKALQKIIESRQVDDETRQRMKEMKRKGGPTA